MHAVTGAEWRETGVQAGTSTLKSCREKEVLAERARREDPGSGRQQGSQGQGTPRREWDGSEAAQQKSETGQLGPFLGLGGDSLWSGMG